MAGLWVNLRFRDGGVLEGIIPNNLMQLEASGFTVTPPDSLGNQQRVLVPREFAGRGGGAGSGGKSAEET